MKILLPFLGTAFSATIPIGFAPPQPIQPVQPVQVVQQAPLFQGMDPMMLTWLPHAHHELELFVAPQAHRRGQGLQDWLGPLELLVVHAVGGWTSPGTWRGGAARCAPLRKD